MHVYRFICEKTVEVKIEGLWLQKRASAKAALDPDYELTEESGFEQLLEPAAGQDLTQEHYECKERGVVAEIDEEKLAKIARRILGIS